MLVKFIVCAILSCTLSVWSTPIAFAQNSQTNSSITSSALKIALIIWLMIALFYVLIFAFNKMIDRDSRNISHYRSIKDSPSNSSSNIPSQSGSQSVSQPASQSVEEISVLYPSSLEFSISISKAWNLRGFDDLNDRLDEQQRTFTNQVNSLISTALINLTPEVADRVNILDNSLLHNIALKQLSNVLSENRCEFLKPILIAPYLSLVDETVSECRRYRIREASKTGNEQLKDLARRITKNDSNRSEIENIAKQEFSEKDFDLFKKTILKLYKKIPYSYYGIYKALQLKNKEENAKTVEEKAYLNEFIFYINRAASEAEKAENQEYS
ncbi:hypothetical protein Cri9333_4950 (plasmid) [Crinalium epipsammum PCC 9333]|uniref:Uncharacterized protein n=1 Tax=Crinalium epipsammum PCC 9333 TaxID=1173022 RepID=K9W6A4_9CYAN|nr:hypothetical protein [Crinalium epipsammum]AFZ15706.1 hypothetical protein Cri9333_4950 [Crinalium epipsammum PCC 9333]